MKLQELAGELRTQLLEFFQTVRITAIQNADQFLAELAAINPDKLPGVLIVYESTMFSATNTIRDERLTLVLIDRFRANSDDRALQLFSALEQLLELFPPEGRMIEEVFVRPEDVQASSPSADFAAVALGLLVSQGS